MKELIKDIFVPVLTFFVGIVVQWYRDRQKKVEVFPQPFEGKWIESGGQIVAEKDGYIPVRFFNPNKSSVTITDIQLSGSKWHDDNVLYQKLGENNWRNEPMKIDGRDHYECRLAYKTEKTLKRYFIHYVDFKKHIEGPFNIEDQEV